MSFNIIYIKGQILQPFYFKDLVVKKYKYNLYLGALG